MSRAFDTRDLNRMISRLKHSQEVLESEATRIVREVAEEGAAEMRKIISTSATPGKSSGSWTSRWFSATTKGRIETGQMLGDVSTAPTKKTARWGWALNGGREVDYYMYQENGFTHWITGKDVPPMHALLGSFLKARESAVRKLDELVK